MPTYRRPPLTLDDLTVLGPPVRLRDLTALTGLSSQTLRADILAGMLAAARRVEKPNSPYFVLRSEARRYVLSLGRQAEGRATNRLK